MEATATVLSPKEAPNGGGRVKIRSSVVAILGAMVGWLVLIDG